MIAALAARREGRGQGQGRWSHVGLAARREWAGQAGPEGQAGWQGRVERELGAQREQQQGAGQGRGHERPGGAAGGWAASQSATSGAIRRAPQSAADGFPAHRRLQRAAGRELTHAAGRVGLAVQERAAGRRRRLRRARVQRGEELVSAAAGQPGPERQGRRLPALQLPEAEGLGAGVLGHRERELGGVHQRAHPLKLGPQRDALAVHVPAGQGGAV